MKRRNLTPNSCVVYAESPYSLIKWNADTTQPSGKVVNLFLSPFFPLSLSFFSGCLLSEESYAVIN